MLEIEDKNPPVIRPGDSNGSPKSILISIISD